MLFSKKRRQEADATAKESLRATVRSMTHGVVQTAPEHRPDGQPSLARQRAESLLTLMERAIDRGQPEIIETVHPVLMALGEPTNPVWPVNALLNSTIPLGKHLKAAGHEEEWELLVGAVEELTTIWSQSGQLEKARSDPNA